MTKNIESYGVKAIDRSKIKARKELDLTGIYGQEIVKSETKLAFFMGAYFKIVTNKA